MGLLRLPMSLLQLATQQYGMLTHEQAEVQQVSVATLLNANIGLPVAEVFPGVIRLGIPRRDNESIYGAWLRFAPLIPAPERLARRQVAAASHQSAGALYGLTSAAAMPTFTLFELIDVAPPGVRLAGGRINGNEVAIINGLPVTGSLRTLNDLLASTDDPGEFQRILAAASQLDLLPPETLAGLTTDHRHRLGLPDTD